MSKQMIAVKIEGFTLVELLVVISIIGLLASTVLASVNSARNRAENAATLQLVGQYRQALELFYDDNNRYPKDHTLFIPNNPVCLGIYPSGTWGSNNTVLEDVNFDNSIKQYIPGLPPLLLTVNTLSGPWRGLTYECTTLTCDGYMLNWHVKEGQSCGYLGGIGFMGPGWAWDTGSEIWCRAYN